MIKIKKQKTLKQTNRKVILNIFRNLGEMSVADLSNMVNLSKPTLMRIIEYYLKKDLVINAGKGNSTEEGGKKPNIYMFNEEGGYAIGMIISANQLDGVITNLKCKVLSRNSMPFKINENFESVLKKIIKMYNLLTNHAQVDRHKIVGFAIGAYGITDYTRGQVIFSPHFPSWGSNINLKDKILENITEDIPVIVDNHIRFQVFAEKNIGLDKEKDNIVAIEAGKGLVAGVIIENEIKRGNNFLIGEIGHMIVDPESKEICACGGRGCFEAMLSTKRIVEMAKDKFKEYPDSILAGNPEKININTIFNAANEGDKLARVVMDDVIKWFGIGISNIILMYDPQVVIIQGIFTGAGSYLMNNLRERINNISLFSIKRETVIKYSEIGNDAGVLGAASYALLNFFY